MSTFNEEIVLKIKNETENLHIELNSSLAIILPILKTWITYAARHKTGNIIFFPYLHKGSI